MTDKQILSVLAEGYPIAAVLLSRGGWLAAREEVQITERFPPDSESPALWRIDLLGEEQEGYHSIYVTAENVVSISCRRTRPHDAQQKRGL